MRSDSPGKIIMTSYGGIIRIRYRVEIMNFLSACYTSSPVFIYFSISCIMLYVNVFILFVGFLNLKFIYVKSG